MIFGGILVKFLDVVLFFKAKVMTEFRIYLPSIHALELLTIPNYLKDWKMQSNKIKVKTFTSRIIFLFWISSVFRPTKPHSRHSNHNLTNLSNKIK